MKGSCRLATQIIDHVWLSYQSVMWVPPARLSYLSDLTRLVIIQGNCAHTSARQQATNYIGTRSCCHSVAIRQKRGQTRQDEKR